MKNHKFTAIDLFSGIGGFREAINSYNGKCINFSEINKDAIETYCLNYNENNDLNLGDITKIKSLPHHDLLTAGVPCQSWSTAGKKLGFDDERGKLWNDTIYLLNQSKPKVFIFENVKGLTDPRNKESFEYILNKIKNAGYYVNYYILNATDYGVPQNRVRVYLIGFKDKKYYDKFQIPLGVEKKSLNFYLNGINDNIAKVDFFSFNDLRNGETTIHSWDIYNTTEKQKEICQLLLKNRRKKKYGNLDGNPLSIEHFQELDSSINEDELNELIKLKILKREMYEFKIINNKNTTENQKLVLNLIKNNIFNINEIKNKKEIKINKINIKKILNELVIQKNIQYLNYRYDFKNTKMSTGIDGINRVFLKNASTFPTLVASDTNDYISTIDIDGLTVKEIKEKFILEVYNKNNYRKITKEEACKIQGFKSEFKLPEKRNKWMRLIGNSVSIPVIKNIISAIVKTNVFEFD